MRYLCVALLIFPSVATIAPAVESPASFSEPAAVLLNVSERDLNRIVVDAFHANGGPRFAGGKGRVSSSVADLSYRARFSDPVIRLGRDGSARLSLDILDASLRIGRLERKIGGRQARCEGAGLEVDPESPLAVDVALGLSIADGALRIVPTSVDIPEAGERIRLVEPARCSNSPLPRWALWWLGKSYFRRSVGNLGEVILKRARTSAAHFEEKGSLLTRRWEKESIRLVPESLDMSGGSLLFALAASSAGPDSRSALPRRITEAGQLPSGSFLGLSESFVNEVARRVAVDKSGSRRKSTGHFRKLVASNSVYALVPGLRKLDSKAKVSFEVTFPEAPRFEFRRLDQGQGALIRVLLTGVQIELRKDEDGRQTLLGTIRVDSGRMAVVPFTNILGGISFRIVENQWRVTSSGLAFDEELVAATLQEITFGKVFATSYEPLLARALHLGETEFRPQSFDVTGGYLVIGLGEPQPPAGGNPAAAARRTGTLLESR